MYTHCAGFEPSHKYTRFALLLQDLEEQCHASGKTVACPGHPDEGHVVSNMRGPVYQKKEQLYMNTLAKRYHGGCINWICCSEVLKIRTAVFSALATSVVWRLSWKGRGLHMWLVGINFRLRECSRLDTRRAVPVQFRAAGALAWSSDCQTHRCHPEGCVGLPNEC